MWLLYSHIVVAVIWLLYSHIIFLSLCYMNHMLTNHGLSLKKVFSLKYKTQDEIEFRVSGFLVKLKFLVKQKFLLVQAKIMWLQIFLILYYYKEVLEVGQS